MNDIDSLALEFLGALGEDGLMTTQLLLERLDALRCLFAAALSMFSSFATNLSMRSRFRFAEFSACVAFLSSTFFLVFS